MNDPKLNDQAGSGLAAAPGSANLSRCPECGEPGPHCTCFHMVPPDGTRNINRALLICLGLSKDSAEIVMNEIERLRKDATEPPPRKMVQLIQCKAHEERLKQHGAMKDNIAIMHGYSANRLESILLAFGIELMDWPNNQVSNMMPEENREI